MLRYSWTIPLGSGAAYVIRWVDSWVIRLFADTTAVGLYNWAYQILDFGTAAFSITALLVTPAIIDARLASDRKRLEEYARRAFCLLALFSGSVLVILPCVHPLMQTLIAPPYHGAYSPLLILVGALPFQLMGYLVSPVANAFEHLVARAMFLNVVVAAANAALDFVLVPVFGYPGAAVATWMALAFSAAAQTWVYSRLIGVTLLPLGGAVWVSALPALGCAAILVSGSSWSGTAFCLILLGVATLWLRRVGIFSRHEVMALLQMGLPVPAKRLFSSWWPG
jgi:O-antigen/teichoic acid export membrane protein